MKILTWNVNGLRAVLKKGFRESVGKINPDIIALQEIKMKKEQRSQLGDGLFSSYHEYWNSADKPGYSGTLVMSRIKPLSVEYGVNGDYKDEGRVITLEYNDFYLVNVYSPNSQRGLTRLSYRQEFEKKFRKYLMGLDIKKSVVLCGDLNVAHKEIDLKNPKNNVKNPGFTIEERKEFTQLLENGFVDVFRKIYPDKIKYTWWSYMFNARKNNAGWRIDYFVVSERFFKNIKDCNIHNEVMGSDHCPLTLEINNN